MRPSAGTLTRTCLLAAATLGAAAAAPARADLITYGPVSYTKLQGEQATLSLPQFDPALGTLTGVTFAASGRADFYFSATNEHNATTVEAVLLRSPVVNFSFQNGPLAFEALLSDQALSSGFTLQPGQSISFSAGSGYSRDTWLPSSHDLTRYIGPGSLTLRADPGYDFNLDLLYGPPATIERLGSSSSGQVSVTYQFTAVPEPFSLGLLSLGVAILGVSCRLRRP